MTNQAVPGMPVYNAAGQALFSPSDLSQWYMGGAMAYLYSPMFQQAWASSGGVNAGYGAAAGAGGAATGGVTGGMDPLFGALGLGGIGAMGGFGAMGDPYYAMTAPGGVSQRPGSYIEMMSRDARGELYGPFSNPDFLKFAAEKYDGVLKNTFDFTMPKDRLIGLLERFYGAQGLSPMALYAQYPKDKISQMADRFIGDNQNNYHDANWAPGLKRTFAGLGLGLGAGAVVGAIVGLSTLPVSLVLGAVGGVALGLASYYFGGTVGSRNEYTDVRGLSKDDFQIALERSSARQKGAPTDLSIRDPRFLNFLVDHIERYNDSYVSWMDGEAISASQMKEAAAAFNALHGRSVGKIDVNNPRFDEDYNMLTVANNRPGWYDATVEKADILAALRANSGAQGNYTPGNGVRY